MMTLWKGSSSPVATTISGETEAAASKGFMKQPLLLNWSAKDITYDMHIFEFEM